MDIFVKQLDGCTFLVDGKPSGGSNCTCAAHAMWLYRASRGRINVTSCRIRQDTGDRSGGTHLGQMEDVSNDYGITGGRVFRPIATSTLRDLVATGRYGLHFQGSYRPILGTSFDCFRGNFNGNHDWYISGPGTKAGTWRVADPGADGRAPGIHTGYEDYPIDLMLRAGASLDVSDPSEPFRALGPGRAYVYLTPPDPIPPVIHFGAIVKRATALWNDSTKRWVYNGANAVKVGTKLEVRGKQFPKGGMPTYPVTCGSYACAYPGYYVPVKNVELGGRV